MDSVKIAVAIRAARGIVGISQGDLAAGTGVPRVTLARLETLRGSLRADQFLVLLDFFKKRGISIELTRDPGFAIRVDQAFIEQEAKAAQLWNTVIPAPDDPSQEPQGQRHRAEKPTQGDGKK